MNDEGAKHIAKGISVSASLTSINLSKNRLGDMLSTLRSNVIKRDIDACQRGADLNQIHV